MPALLEPQEAPDRGRVILRTGEIAEIRPLGSQDAALVERLVGRQAPEDLSLRFLSEIRSDGAARALMNAASASTDTLAVVASREGAAAEIVALGSLAADGHGSTPEIGILVDESWRGRGLGTALVERLAQIALMQGAQELMAIVRRDNQTMLEVLSEIGFPMAVKAIPDSGGCLDVRLDLSRAAAAATRFGERERAATVASLAPFFRPRAVAVVGASRSGGGIGRRILDNLVGEGYLGAVYSVHPQATSIGSVRAYPSVEALPDDVDLLVVAVPAAAVEGVLEGAARRGIGAVVVISANFAETGGEGRQRQERITELTRQAGIRMIGPNCLGVANTAADVHLNASFAPQIPPPGTIAMASQSGALGLAMVEYARAQGLGISTFVSMGNKADVSGNDLLQYWEQDPDTRVIALYLESFGNPRRFARIARRVGRSKPVLMVKAARTAAGGRAAASHTAALMSSDRAVGALVEQSGVVRCDTLEELFEAASLLARQSLPAGPRVAVVTNAGGPGILAADALAAAGMETPPPSAETRAELASTLSAAASLGNPFDMIASATPEDYANVLRHVLTDKTYDAVIAMYVEIDIADKAGIQRTIAEEAARSRAQGGTRPVLACVMDQSPDRPTALVSGSEVVPVYAFPESAARALGAAYRYAAWRAEPEAAVPVLEGLDLVRAHELICRALERGEGWMEPLATFELLGAIGVPAAMPRLARDADEAARIAQELYAPVAVKIASRTLTHKSDLGGVRVNLVGGVAVGNACREMLARLRSQGRAEAVDGFLVQPMAPAGVECMVGVSTDASFGPLVAFGLGGTAVEALHDVTVGLPPLTDRDARRMVDGIRARALLGPFRGRAETDRAALVDVLLRVSTLVDLLPEVAELDLNPVIALPVGQGVCVVDARVSLRRAPD